MTVNTGDPSRGVRVTLGAGVGIGATLAMASSASAAFTVTNLDDTGPGSLRDAISQANTNPGGDAIVFQSGLSGSIAVASPMDIDDPLFINGPVNKGVTLDGGQASGILSATAEGPDPIGLRIYNLNFKDGSANNYGGAIDAYNMDLSIKNSTFTGNQAPQGGAIYRAGPGFFNVYQSTFSGNRSAVGGAFLSSGFSTQIYSSTFNNNVAQYAGGAIAAAYAPLDSDMKIINSTFNRNSSGFIGGAVGALTSGDDLSLRIYDTTVSGNQTTLVGGGIGGNFSTAKATNSVVEGNFAYYGPDLYGGSFGGPPSLAPGPGCGCDQTPFDLAFTFVGDTSGATINPTVPGSNILNGGDALLHRLADNGGFTETMALGADSPVVNKGAAGGLNVDQRGDLRPVEYPNISNSTAAGADGSDMGAYELQYTAPPPPPPPIVDRPFRILTGSSNRKTGVETIKVEIPAAGTVEVVGYKAIKSTSTHFDTKGTYSVKAVPKGKFKKRLNKRGRARKLVKFRYTPDVGTVLAKGKNFAFFKGASSGKAKAAAVRKMRSFDGWGRGR